MAARKPAEVADDASAEGDEQRVAVGSARGELLREVFDAGAGACGASPREGRERSGHSLKLARNGFDQSAQISGEVTTKGRNGLVLIELRDAVAGGYESRPERDGDVVGGGGRVDWDDGHDVLSYRSPLHRLSDPGCQVLSHC